MGLRWGTVDGDGAFTVFRAAKFRLWELAPELIRKARARRSCLLRFTARSRRAGYEEAADEKERQEKSR
jgi:hypothetical protein